MKFGKVVLLVLVMALAASHGVAQGQASVYGEFSSSILSDLSDSRVLYGATTGVLYQGPTLFHRIVVDADIQGRFVTGSNESLNGVTVGPRFSIPMRHGLAPYAEFMVGFARYKSTGSNPNEQALSGTTDSTIQVNGGLTKRLTAHLDAVMDYSYAQYYALGGLYNPKTASGGLIYHFTKR